MDHTGTPLTYDDYARLPDDGYRHEILAGEHVVTPAPSSEHQTVSVLLASELVHAIHRTGLGRVFSAPIDVQLAAIDIVQPDLLVVLAHNESIIQHAKLVGTPDLVIEILSPSTHRTDSVRKKRIYARAGVAEYWLVDPACRRIEQFVLEGNAFCSRGICTRKIRLYVSPDVTIELSRIF